MSSRHLPAVLAVALLACRGKDATPTPEAGAPASHDLAPAASRPQVGRPPRPSRPPVDVAALASVASAVVRREPPSTFALDASVRKVLCDNRDGAFPQARLAPELADGGWATPGATGPWGGVRVFGIRPEQLLGRLGMVNGDLLLAVDEIRLDSRDAGDSAMERLCTAPWVVVHVFRGSQEAGLVDLRWRMDADGG